ncbi:MAG TPA: sigma-70 family RNA polymerase sigma factor [Steroidobacteraceae bacterium]|jgi:RNA polymerase sigma-70 factor (ECF subfamily)|nr:sigma-70 family RNA polymerase sigma factor [Steroidobacteraceae bacterium]
MHDVEVGAAAGQPGAAPAVPRDAPGKSSTEDLTPLLHRILAGDEAALAELYDATVGRLYSFACLIVRDARDAEEVICDVYVQVWQSADRYDLSRGSVLAWLLTICRSRALDLRRRLRARASERGESLLLAQGVVAGPLAGPHEHLYALEQSTLLSRAMARLSPLRRRLVWLAFFEGLTHEEIVDQTGLARGTVKSHIRRALATLRAALSRRGEDGKSA